MWGSWEGWFECAVRVSRNSLERALVYLPVALNINDHVVRVFERKGGKGRALMVGLAI